MDSGVTSSPTYSSPVAVVGRAGPKGLKAGTLAMSLHMQAAAPGTGQDSGAGSGSMATGEPAGSA